VKKEDEIIEGRVRKISTYYSYAMGYDETKRILLCDEKFSLFRPNLGHLEHFKVTLLTSLIGVCCLGGVGDLLWRAMFVLLLVCLLCSTTT